MTCDVMSFSTVFQSYQDEGAGRLGRAMKGCVQWNPVYGRRLKRFCPSKSEPSPEVIKLFSCSTQLSMKFFPLINVKMPTIIGILTCMSGKNNILGLTEP